MFKCSLCSEKSTVQEDVFEHVALVHLNILQFKCQECGSKFKLRFGLKEQATLDGSEMLFMFVYFLFPYVFHGLFLC